MPLSWDEVVIEVEDVTEEEAKEIESGGRQARVGLYKCTVVDSSPKQIDYAKYSTLGCTLKFQIDEVLELDGKPVTGDEGQDLEGSFLFDDVSFAPAAVEEPAWAKKRRKMVAMRLGLVAPGGMLTKDAWKTEVIGKRALIRVVPGDEYQAKDANKNPMVDENGNPIMKVGRPRIGFWDGYLKLDGPAAKQEAWEDI